MGSNKEVKNIIFDFGGVILNINHKKVENAFKRLGLHNFEELFNKASQSELFQDFETGKLDTVQFRDSIRNLTALQIDDRTIDDTWNEIICDYPPHRIASLKSLAFNYRLFLLSNTNKIHFDYYIPKFKREFGFDFTSLFEKAFWSFEIGMRKPNPDPFLLMLEECGIKASETLFIDDSLQNVITAIELGFKTYHLIDPMDMCDLSENGKMNDKLIF